MEPPPSPAPSPRPRGPPPRAARGQPLLAGGARAARDAAFHHLRDHGLRGLLHGLLLHPGRGRRRWPAAGTELPKLIAGFNTAILISSSFTIHSPRSRSRTTTAAACRPAWSTTFLLGLTFLFIQINEYVHIGFSPQDSAQGSIFYGLTGLHGAHVTIGLMLLAFVTIRSFRGHYSRRGVPRHGGAGHLLALRRRDVDRRLLDGLHHLRPRAVQPAALRGRRPSASCSTCSRSWSSAAIVLHRACVRRAALVGTARAYLTVSLPSMPPSRWPGTEQKKVYVPGLRSTVTFEAPPLETTGPFSSTPLPSMAMLCWVDAAFLDSI